MTDKREEGAADKQNGDDLVPEPKSGAGYGNDAEELQKRSAPQEGEEKSA